LRQILTALQGKKLHIIVLTVIAVLLNSCNINRFVPEGKYLVKSNSVVIEEKNTEISKSKLSSYIALKPYKNTFQTKIPTWIYYKSERRPNSKLWKWMNHSFGKEPVYYEKLEANRSSDQMMRYLNKVGYFHSKVRHEVSTRRKRAKVRYVVTPTEPYRVNKMEYVVEDSLMRAFIMRDKSRFTLNEGDIYNELSLADDRDMITERLRNSGYYYFTRNDISYEVDSNYLNHTLSVTMRVSKNPLSHKRYYINKISIYPNFSLFRMHDRPSDTASLTVKVGRRNIINNLDFYYFDKQNVKPKTFSRSIQILQRFPYNLRSVTGTYQNINNFRLFGNVNITFDTVPNSNDSLNLLDCKITMQQNDVHSVTLQTESTNSDGDLGIKGSLSYTNRNVFHGAETFQFGIRGGLEAQKLIGIDGQESESKKFNTRELGVTTSLTFPKFLSPIHLRDIARDYQPTTTIGLGYNMQIRYYYSRYISSASFGYDWKTNYRLKQTFLPVYVNGVKIDNIDSTFQSFLDMESNQRKKDQYTNHLILGTRYSLIYSTQSINNIGSFIYFRTDLESSGNLLSLFNNTKLMTEDDGYHKLFGIRYAQYVRTSFDLREHLDLGGDSWLVFRQFLGLGLPYGNSRDLPFERSFYAGGANSLRGWTYHGVGPGGFDASVSDMERIGDMQLELNAEVRFPLYNVVNGAVFFDAGNVWTYYPNVMTPSSEFRFREFYKQIAMDAGFGLRIDVSFLILRVDLAYAMRNPFPDSEGSYWRFGKGGNFKLNMGIGYPF